MIKTRNNAGSWIEKAKLTLDYLESTAQKANMEAQRNLRNAALNLFKYKIRKYKAGMNLSNIVQNFLSAGLIYVLPTEYKTYVRNEVIKENASMVNNLALYDAMTDKIMQAIPSMNPYELHQLIKEIINKKSITEIYSTLYGTKEESVSSPKKWVLNNRVNQL